MPTENTSIVAIDSSRVEGAQISVDGYDTLQMEDQIKDFRAKAVSNPG